MDFPPLSSSGHLTSVCVVPPHPPPSPQVWDVYHWDRVRRGAFVCSSVFTPLSRVQKLYPPGQQGACVAR